MKLNVKMMLLFSAMMLAAVAVLSSYSTQLNIDSFTDLSNQQFHNISHTVSEALDQQISLMDLVLEELLDNASFMAAINQFVRDDSDDQKVGTAAQHRFAAFIPVSSGGKLLSRQLLYPLWRLCHQPF